MDAAQVCEDFMRQMEGKLSEILEAVKNVNARVDVLERKLDGLPVGAWNQVDERLPRDNERRIQVTKPLMEAEVVPPTLEASKRVEPRARMANPRAIPGDFVSLAKQKALPPPKEQHARPISRKFAPTNSPETIPELIEQHKHKWSDGSLRLAPQEWQFPMTTCRTMWEYWYQGSDEPHMGPFRLLRQRDISTSSCRVQMSQARRVMKKLEEIALSCALASSEDALNEMPRFKSMSVFDRAFKTLCTSGEGQYLIEPLQEERAAAYTYRQIYESLIKDKHKTGVDEAGHACSQDAPACALVPWQFPSTTCKAMWIYWFQGDPSQDIGPFRHLRSRDVDRFGNDRRARKLLSSARILMERLIDLSMEHNIVNAIEDLDEMDASALDDVFTKAFQHLLNNGGGSASSLSLSKASKYTYTTVYHAMAFNSRRKRPRDGDSPTRTSIDDPSVADNTIS